MKFLRIRSVLQQTGFRSHVTIYKAIRLGLFPKPVRIGQRAVGWPANEVDAVNMARAANISDGDIRQLVQQLHNARAGWARGQGDFDCPEAMPKTGDLSQRQMEVAHV
ncbi:MAG: AlpA family phage regulatory protein [Planctomycetota bacterium]